jgi:hypothetical protein
MWSSKRLGLVVATGAWLGLSWPALAEVDLAALEVVPARGQSADQARRDRYECHNWAVDQTGAMPVAGDDAPSARERRAERTGRILNGAGIGGALGGLIRGVQRKNPSNGVLAGAAVGAAVAAATGREQREAADAGDSDYLRALSACLEGRGYQVAVPGEDGEVVAASAN